MGEVDELREELRQVRAEQYATAREVIAVRAGWTMQEAAIVAGLILIALALATAIGEYAVDVAKNEGVVTRDLLSTKLDALKEAFVKYTVTQAQRDSDQDAESRFIRERQDAVRFQLNAAERSNRGLARTHYQGAERCS